MGKSEVVIHMEADSSLKNGLSPKFEVLENATPSKTLPPEEASVESLSPDIRPETVRKEKASDVCFENPVYENGGPKQNGTVENGPVAKAEGEPEAAEEGIDKRRLYIVRMPLPPEGSSAIPGLEQEHDALKTQVKLLDVNVDLKKTNRTRARERVAAARNDWVKSKQQLDAIDEKLKPINELKKKRRTEQDGLRNAYADLEVRTEAELEEKLRFLNDKYQHETNSLNEEKSILRHIKKLEGLHDRVREYQEKAAVLATTKGDVDKHQDDAKVLEAERKTAFEDFQLQKSVWQKLKEEESSLDKEVVAIMDERKRVKSLADEVFHKMAGLKREHRGKTDAFYNNRRFSRNIRELCKAGKEDEARAECEKQMNEVIAKLGSDTEFRSQYMDLWETQRPYSVYGAANDFDLDDPALMNETEYLDISGKKGGGTASLEARAKAEAVIAAALGAAKLEPPPVEKEVTAVPAAAPVDATGGIPSGPGGDRAALEKLEQKKSAKLLKKEKPKPVVAPPVVDDTPFVLPESIAQGAVSEASTEEKRQQERARQLALAKEAEAKRERKRKLAEKKKQKAAEKPAAPVVPVAALVEVPEPAAFAAPPPPEEEAAPVAKRELTARPKSKPAASVRAPTSLGPKKAKKKGFMKTLKQYQLYVVILVVLLVLGVVAWFAYA